MNHAKIVKLIMYIGLLAGLGSVGCTPAHRHVVGSYPWYDVYGNVCSYGSPAPGCNFYADGTQIVDVEDPFFASSYYLEWNIWTYYDVFGYPQIYAGYGWLSPNGILYDDYGYALNEEGEEKSKDILGEAAKQEEEKIGSAGKSLSERFSGLSEESGAKIARTLNDWATLPKKQSRKRTEADVSALTSRLYGIDISEATAALTEAQKGNLEKLQQANELVAESWGTSPETSKAILQTWFKKQVDEYQGSH